MSNLLYGELEELAQALAGEVRGAGREGRTTRALTGGGRDEDAVRRALAALEAQGEVVDRQGRWLAPEAAGYRVGTVRAAGRGGATVVTSAGPPATFAIEPDHLRGALQGDRVLVRALGRRRGQGGRRTATVVRVLERRHATVVGSLEPAGRGSWRLVPFDRKVALDIEVRAGEGEVEAGEYVVVEVDRPQGIDRARGRIVEALGTLDEAGTDVRVVLRHYGIPDEFPDEVVAASEALPEAPREGDLAGREDLRGLVTVTIDGASARDFDDALTVEPRNRGWRVGVHIADVSHYVEEGSVLDAEAYHRGTSVYYPDRAVPMLPERLSNGLCSLRPDVARLTLSAFLDIDAEGRVTARRFARTVIRSDRRLTYDEVRRLLEEPAAADAADYGPVLDLLRAAAEVMAARRAMREERGALDFDLPEGDVVLDTDGVVVGVRPTTRHVAHRIVEEMMIAANEAVAEELEGAGVPALYRVHRPPDEEDLNELRDLLEPLGIDLPGASEVHPKDLQAVLERVRGTPEEAFVSAVVLRSQQRAVYSGSPDGHYALATLHYLHFTSPIRRYPDLVVHRQLVRHLCGESGRDLSVPRLEAAAQHTSTTERRAEQSERELLQWKKVRFLADRVGERFTGRVTGVQPFGLFVQLDELAVDGLVPVATLGDDYYRHEADTHRLVGVSSGRTFRLAQAVEVDLVGVEPRHRGLDLRIASGEAGAGRRRGRQGRRRERSSR